MKLQTERGLLARLALAAPFIIGALATIAYVGGTLPSLGDAVQQPKRTVSNNKVLHLGKPEVSIVQMTNQDGLAFKLSKMFFGKLVYASYKANKATELIVCEAVNPFDHKNLTQFRKTVYPFLVPTEKSDRVFGPVLSPDGRYIAFRFGRPSKILDSYLLYILDTQDSSIKLISTSFLSNDLVSWSPDGAFLAYVKGGDYNGNTWFHDTYEGPLQLFVYDLRSGRAHLVTANDTVAKRVSWIAPHTLIYSELSRGGQTALQKRAELRSLKGETRVNPSANEPRPDAYRYLMESNRSDLIIHDGYLPQASRDGEWLAFYGSEDTKSPIPLTGNWQEKARESSLSITRLNGNDRVALNRESGLYSLLHWLPSNDRFLEFEISEGLSSIHKCQIKEWNIKTKKFRVVAIVTTQDYKPTSTSLNAPRVLPMGTSATGSEVYLLTSHIKSLSAERNAFDVLSILSSIQLKSGHEEVLAQMSENTVFHWVSAEPVSAQ